MYLVDYSDLVVAKPLCGPRFLSSEAGSGSLNSFLYYKHILATLTDTARVVLTLLKLLDTFQSKPIKAAC